MYWVSPKELHMIDYCKGIEDFIHYMLSNTKNISGGSIRYSYKRRKNKKVSWSRCCHDASFTKKRSWKNTCVGLYTENRMFLMRPC
jgi:hypothetical protein